MSFLPDVNVSKIAGTATAVNAGVNSAGVQRVTIATDDAPTTETHGTKAAGTAAAKSDLVGMVAASAAAAPTNGQQIAFQGDLLGNVRINPTGQVGSFVMVSQTPAAGVDATITVPAATKYRVKSFRVRLTTDATVANRITRIVMDDGTANSFYSAVPGNGTSITQAGSLTRDYVFGPSYATETVFDASNNISTGCPEASLGPGYRIRTVTTLIKAGDQLSIFANVEQYSD